jgi:hypothetical protein
MIDKVFAGTMAGCMGALGLIMVFAFGGMILQEVHQRAAVRAALKGDCGEALRQTGGHL